MHRYSNFVFKLPYLFLFFCIACCSNKDKSINDPVVINQNINKNNENISSQDKNYNTKISSDPLVNNHLNNKNESLHTNQVSNVEDDTFDKLKSTENDTNNTEPEDNLNSWFVPKDVKILNKNFHYIASLSKNIKFNSVNNVFIVDTVPHYFTAFEFYKRFFTNFEIIGYSIFLHNKSFKFKYIERIAKAKGSNLVILKKIHNREKENYIYDILYLKGNLYNQDYYWMRNSQEAIPINITLESIANSQKDISKSYLSSNLRIKNVDSYVKNEPSVQYKENSILQPLNENIDSFFQLMQETAENDVSSEAPIDIMDKGYKALATRVSNVVGLWMDCYDKTIVRIQEISGDKIKKYDKTTFDESKIKYYGAYVEFKDDEEMREYNYHRVVNNDEKLLWHNNDLKFQFNSSGSNGVFLNRNKMPVPASIKTFPAKGVLMVNLPSGEIRYYIPVDFTNIKPEIVKKLYSKLPSYVEGKETSIGNDISSTGYGLYGWLIYTGLVILGLGIVSFI